MKSKKFKLVTTTILDIDSKKASTVVKGNTIALPFLLQGLIKAIANGGCD